MPDENVEQGQMAQDYMSMYEPEDDSPDEPIAEGAEPSQKTPEGGKEVGSPQPEPGKSPDAGSGSEPKPEDFKIPEGFDGQWYEKGEDGNVTFKTNEALEFYIPKKEYEGFKAPAIQYAEPTTPAEPPKDEYEQFYDDEVKRQNSVRENLNLGLDYMAALIEKGYQPNEAMEYARAKVKELVDKDIRETNIRHAADMRKRNDERYNQLAESSQLEKRAKTNENFFINYFGGGEKGVKAYEEMIKTAWPYLTQSYLLNNPDGLNGKTQAEANSIMSDYYNKIASNMNTLKMFMEIARRESLERILPHMLERGMSGNKPRNPNLRSTSGINPSHGAPPEKGGLETFLEGGSIDSV